VRRLGPLFLLLLLPAPPVAAQGQAVADLVAELGGEDANRRSQAMTELRDRQDPKAIPLLVAALPGYEHMGQYYGVLVLEAYPQKLAEPALRALVTSEPPYLRLAAATAVYRYGDPRTVPVIVKALTLPDVPPDIRMYMLNRLYSIGDPKILDAVRSLVVPGAEVTVIGAAMNLLGNVPDDASRTMAANLLADPRPGVRAMALALLYRMGEEHRAVEIAAVLRSGEVEYDEFIRVRSLLYPMTRMSAEILDAVLSLLETETDTNTLSQGIGLLEKFRHRKAIPVLTKLLAHQNRMVSKAAFEALSALGGGLDAGALYPLLESEDLDRRLMAADALRRMDDPAGFPALVAILASGQNQQRADAAKALGGFRTAEAVEPLLAALVDDYPTTRMYAETSLLQVLRALYPYKRFDLATTGYQRDGSPAAREAAVEKIREWWSANR
jgi:HEAT repeat protein